MGVMVIRKEYHGQVWYDTVEVLREKIPKKSTDVLRRETKGSESIVPWRNSEAD